MRLSFEHSDWLFGYLASGEYKFCCSFGQEFPDLRRLQGQDCYNQAGDELGHTQTEVYQKDTFIQHCLALLLEEYSIFVNFSFVFIINTKIH